MTHSIYNYRFTGAAVKKWLRTHAKVVALGLAFATGAATTRAHAANDLLVAPTRLEFNNRTRSTEVVLSNIGSKAATYRVSLVVKRMTEDGKLEEIETPTEADQRVIDMVSYAPRRVVLEPNQPQAIRVAVRKPADLANGEYRVHMLFRAVPDANPVVASEAPTEGFAIQLIPIYGITIPVIVRNGDLKATTDIVAPHIEVENGTPMLAFDLARTGDRSTYGEIRVLKPGVAEPVIEAKGLAVYTEVASRKVLLPANPAYKGPLNGPATIQYFELEGDASRLVAEKKVELN